MSTMIHDQIVDLAERLGYGVDMTFDGRKPACWIQPSRGKGRPFDTFEDALKYLEDKVTAIQKLHGI